MRRVRLLPVFATLVALLVSPAFASSPADHGKPTVQSKLEKAKAATKRFRDVNVALANGYIATTHCEQDPDLGAMGYHYYNPELGSDPRLRKRYPEFLLYLPSDTGGLKLGGIEYFRPDADQDLSTDSDRPIRFRQPFDGPMAGHFPGQPMHYDLHVWLFQDNPAGMFARYNPAASC